MSGYAADELARRELVALSEALLQKPFTPQQLLSKLAKMQGLDRN